MYFHYAISGKPPPIPNRQEWKTKPPEDCAWQIFQNYPRDPVLKKSCMQETKHLLTDADSSANT